MEGSRSVRHTAGGTIVILSLTWLLLTAASMYEWRSSEVQFTVRLLSPPLAVFLLALAALGLRPLIRWRTLAAIVIGTIGTAVTFFAVVAVFYTAPRWALIAIFACSSIAAVTASGIFAFREMPRNVSVLVVIAALLLVGISALGVYGTVNQYDYTETAPASAPPPDQRECPDGPFGQRSMAIGAMASGWFAIGYASRFFRRREVKENGLTKVSNPTAAASEVI